jgi:hypothetical protein
MAGGASSIDDMEALRHGALGTLFAGIRAPSTLGSHLRSYTWGNVQHLEKAGREFLARLAREAPLLHGADVLAAAPGNGRWIQAKRPTMGHRIEPSPDPLARSLAKARRFLTSLGGTNVNSILPGGSACHPIPRPIWLTWGSVPRISSPP